MPSKLPEYTLSFDMLLDIPGHGRRRFPIDCSVSRSFKKSVGEHVQAVVSESAMKERSPEEWKDILEAWVVDEDIRAWAGAIAWWDHCPNFPVTERYTVVQNRKQELLNMYAVCTCKRPLQLRLRDLNVADDDLIPDLLMAGELHIADLPEPLQQVGLKLLHAYKHYIAARKEQQRWACMASEYVYDSERVQATDTDKLMAALRNIGYFHPEWRLGLTNTDYQSQSGWKKNFKHKILTKWGKEVKAHTIDYGSSRKVRD